MTKRTRQIFVICLVLISVISLPLILLYGSGYRINWQSLALQRTGSLLLQVFPKNSVLTILERNQQIKNPTLINRLPAQRYTLRISKQHYANWSAAVEVKNNYTTNLGSIVLFLAEPTINVLTGYPKSTIISTLSNTEATTVLHYSPYEIQLSDVATQKSRVILRQSTAITEAHWHPLEENIIYVAGNQVLAIETRVTDQPNMFTLYTGTKPHDLRFNKSGDTIYLTDEGKVLEIQIM
jgi:hypothetical protein